MPRAKRYWLMKSEPDVYAIDDLERDGTTHWDGVRNYQARNFMRDEMKVGDLVLFYHSNAKPPGVTGIAQVVKEGYPDHTAWDKKSKYHDPKSDPAEPRWSMVDIGFVERFPDVVPLDALKADTRFDDMLVTQRGQRLSVQPVEKRHFEAVRKLGKGR